MAVQHEHMAVPWRTAMAELNCENTQDPRKEGRRS
jgi:hypothetical protein